ncbi:MAG: FAD-dependent oxidoreductase [Methanomassiliicoccales archaeon]|nr:FAD-dependent oxidoreductase [Methanomassiliicoccales archaeon]
MGWFSWPGHLASRRGKYHKCPFGKEFEDYRSRAEKEFGIRMLRGTRVASIDEDPETKNLILRYSSGAETNTEEFDLVVLSVGFEPSASVHDLAKTSASS